MKLIHRRNVLPLIAVIVLTTGAWACPKSSDIDRAAKASNELAHDAVVAEKSVAALYNAGKLGSTPAENLQRKDSIAAKLKTIAVNGKKFNDALIVLDKKYPQGTLPPQDLQFLKDNWQLVAGPFLQLFSELDLLGALDSVKELNEDVTTIDKVINK